IMNVNCLTTDAPFSVFENFGFKSGKENDKFKGVSADRTKNGLIIVPDYVGAVISLKVENYIDVGSHGMFICEVTETKKISDADNMTYSYYHKNVKPAPKSVTKKGFVCKICGYVYEGDTLPEDYICPLCKHGAADFEPIEK
ncbi:MAG: flavin reductase, partial [Clostridia bacterium]|nr:flavin reductase [Clostridia bacterium]